MYVIAMFVCSPEAGNSGSTQWHFSAKLLRISDRQQNVQQQHVLLVFPKRGYFCCCHIFYALVVLQIVHAIQLIDRTCLMIIIIERTRLGWHQAMLRGHLTNDVAKRKRNENSRSQITLLHGYVVTSRKLREKSSVLSRRLKVDRELDDRTSGNRVFQTCAATIGKARSPAVDRFDVGIANVSDDHDRGHCLNGRSLMLRRSTDRYAGASQCRHRYTRTAIL